MAQRLVCCGRCHKPHWSGKPSGPRQVGGAESLGCMAWLRAGEVAKGCGGLSVTMGQGGAGSHVVFEAKSSMGLVVGSSINP